MAGGTSPARTGEAEGEGRLSGLIPLAVAGVAVILFMRSCLPGLSWVPLVSGRDGSSASEGYETGDGAGSDEKASAEQMTEPVDPTGRGQPGGTAAPASDTAITSLDPGPERSRMLQPRDPVCPAEDGTSPRHLQWTRPPPRCIDPSKTYLATLNTDRGDIVIQLDTESAPVTANHLVFLARWHFYDRTAFHQIVTYNYIVGGDPIRHPPGMRGDPGYLVPDELPAELPTGEPTYPIYSLCLINREEPDSGLGTFFIVTGMGAQISHGYTCFGQVVQGRSVVNAIDDTGLQGQGPTSEDPTGEDGPTEPTVIHTITITDQ